MALAPLRIPMRLQRPQGTRRLLPFAVTPRVLAFLILTLLQALPGIGTAKAFDVSDADAKIKNERLELDFNLELVLSKEAIDALNHGIDLSLSVEVELRRKRRFMIDELVETLRRDIEIRYHGLSRRYVVQESGVGTVTSHLSVAEALQAIGRGRRVLIPVPELPTNQSIDYIIAIRTRLNSETLPTPLKLISRLSPSWRLDSGWTKWPVRY